MFSPTFDAPPPWPRAAFPFPVPGVLQANSRKQELEHIADALRARLRDVCAHMRDDDFDALIVKMAEVQWRSEHPPASSLWGY